MRAKIVTALIALPLLLWVIWSSPGLFLLLLFIGALLSWRELSAMLAPAELLPWWVFAPVMALALSEPFFSHHGAAWALFGLLVALCFWSVLWVREPTQAFPATVYSLAGAVLILVPHLSIAYLHQQIEEGRRWVLFLLLVVWLGDGIAFLVGSQVGRRPLAPTISPKKTIEGAIANVLGAALIAISLRWLLSLPLSVERCFGLGLCLGVLSIVGDLWESQWKRFADLKDSAQLLPGHGGILDRIDSLTLTAPFLWLYLAASSSGRC